MNKDKKKQQTTPPGPLSLYKNIFIYARDNRILYLNPEIPDWISIKNKYKGIFDRFDGSNSLANINKYISGAHKDESVLLLKQVKNLTANTKIFEHNCNGKPGKCDLTAIRPRYIYLTLTDRCNLNCRYCYAGERETVPESGLFHWLSAIDGLLELARPLDFTFTGGEPLMLPFVFDLAKYIKKSGSHAILLTNGLRITNRDMAERISRYFDEVKISLDSINDSISTYLRGRDVLASVVRARNLLLRAGAKVTIVATVTQINKEKLRGFCSHFGNGVSFQPLYAMGAARGCGELTISGDDYYNALNDADILTSLPGYRSNILNFAQRPYKRCAFGIEELSIAPNGDIFPCHMLHYPELRIGNIHQENIKALYNESALLKTLRGINVDSLEQCRSCVVRNFCGAGCRARVDIKKSGIRGSDAFCSFERKSIMDALLYSFA